MTVDELTPAECRDRLASARVGRLGVTVQALPVVLPVYFALDGGAIVIRTAAGTKLAAATAGSVVAFEVDHYDEVHFGGWSVLVQGRASEIGDAEGLRRARALPLQSVGTAGPDHFIAVALDVVTGRRISPAPAPGSPSRAQPPSRSGLQRPAAATTGAPDAAER
jgi:hypothetical protein